MLCCLERVRCHERACCHGRVFQVCYRIESTQPHRVFSSRDRAQWGESARMCARSWYHRTPQINTLPITIVIFVFGVAVVVVTIVVTATAITVVTTVVVVITRAVGAITATHTPTTTSTTNTGVVIVADIFFAHLHSIRGR